MHQLKFYWVVPAYHTEFGLATICLKACGTIPVAWESICKARRFFSTFGEAALIIFYMQAHKSELVQFKNTRQLEVRIECMCLSGVDHYTKNINSCIFHSGNF